jgi:arylamine N-acetyltransferase
MATARSFDRYLAILGVAATPPAPDHLTRLVGAQLVRVPFENVSKLYLRKRFGATSAPSLDEYLDGIERCRFGGTCFASNPHFYRLLRHLGYDVTLCGADMSRPDVHVVSIVRLQGREYLVDVGYAAPFFEPLPRDLATDHEIRFGACRYVLAPQDCRARSRLTVFRHGQEIHGYQARPEPREIGHFREVIAASYRDAATFMNAVVVERFFPGRSVRIHNLSLTESTSDRASVTRLADRDELIQAVERHAEMSADIIRAAVEGVTLEGDLYT